MDEETKVGMNQEQAHMEKEEMALRPEKARLSVELNEVKLEQFRLELGRLRGAPAAPSLTQSPTVSHPYQTYSCL